MDKIIFRDNDKIFTLDILNYEFPDMTGNKDDYDANWLVVEITYSDTDLAFIQKDSCLLSFELKNLIDSLDLIILGKETGIIKTFMEPYLSLALTKIRGEYAFQIRFVYDTEGTEWKEAYICVELDDAELMVLKERLKAQYDKFPYRPVD